mmetsp:Transcript_85426/g.153808  ORF Transcript_85426/g.153808 Transcript_85426/m.153808 type:complete len:108 (-) Transcript_85426:16-339(-)
MDSLIPDSRCGSLVSGCLTLCCTKGSTSEPGLREAVSSRPGNSGAVKDVPHSALELSKNAAAAVTNVESRRHRRRDAKAACLMVPSVAVITAGDLSASKLSPYKVNH